jgi:hypothetical protein
MMLQDENEMMIEYSEMASFDFNCEAYREVKEVEEAINGIWATLAKFWLSKAMM